MNYTSNHHLPQWVSSDRVRMEDFNSAMANIESGLTSVQSAANSAKSAAASAYSPDNKPYVIGSYTGKSSNQVITLGFMPAFLIISGMQASTTISDTSPFDWYFAIVGSNGDIVNQQLQHRVQLLDEGFAVYKAGNQGSSLPLLNEAGRTYYYIAFR